MAKKEETKFAERVDRDLAEAFGEHIFIENIQQVSKVGSPDRLICLAGRYVALELKVEKGQPSKLQLLKLARIERAGGYSAVVFPETWPYVLEELRHIYETIVSPT